MASFEALELAHELARALGALLPQIQQHDRDLAIQLRRAGASAPSCLSEGAQRQGRDRLQLYRTAAGSAAEIHTQLRIAIAWNYIERRAAEEALTLADRTVAITWRLVHPRR